MMQQCLHYRLHLLVGNYPDATYYALIGHKPDLARQYPRWLFGHCNRLDWYCVRETGALW